MSVSVKPQSAIFLITLATVGVLLIIIGALFGLSGKLVFLVNMFATLGGAILGTASSLLMARYFEPSQLDQLFQLISESHSSPLMRDDRQLEPFRVLYHGYLKSHRDDGQPVWRYRVFDFSRAHTPGHLHATVPVMLPGAGSKDFVYDGYICSQHLVLVGRPTFGAEPFVVHVFPNGTSLEGHVITGLCFVRSFDKAQLVAPTMLSTTRLIDQTQAGPVADEDAKVLTRTWEAQFLKHNELNFANPSAGQAQPSPSP